MIFFEATLQGSGKRVTFNLAHVRRVIEQEDGCFILTLETKKDAYGVYVNENYEAIQKKIVNARCIG